LGINLSVRVRQEASFLFFTGTQPLGVICLEKGKSSRFDLLWMNCIKASSGDVAEMRKGK
jgi:hypothetical protein